jgi:hypothetical protein
MPTTHSRHNAVVSHRAPVSPLTLMAPSDANNVVLNLAWLCTAPIGSQLQKDNKSLKKKASKLPGLEKAVLEMGREDVEQLRTSVQQLQHRLRLAEEGLETTAQAKQQLRGQLDELKASGEAEQWLAREQVLAVRALEA